MFTPKESEKDDFFDGPDTPPTPPPVKKPAPLPDTPEYWEEESEWEHLRPIYRLRWRLYLVGFLAVLGVCIALYVRYFAPYETGATQYGYVEQIKMQGDIFKTYEGSLIPYKEVHDTTRIYDRNFDFSASDAKVAAVIKRMQIAGKPIRVEYKTYHTTLPWRGASKTVVYKADSVDPRTILPPDFLTDPSYNPLAKPEEGENKAN